VSEEERGGGKGKGEGRGEERGEGEELLKDKVTTYKIVSSY
jgi:hypothetical protein